EYAILGTATATVFVEISNPTFPEVISVQPASTSSVWRDIKTYQTYAYSVSEANVGIQVFDLAQIDQGVVTLANTVFTGGSGSSHNVAINEDSGYLYRTGGSGNGLAIYSLADPAAPDLVRVWDERYVHDAQVVTYTEGPYAGREIAFCCGGFGGGWVETGLDILDVTDKDNIIQLARYQYPNGVYSHQGWLSEDKQYFYLGDELDEGDLGITTETKVIDVSDLENPVEVTVFTNDNAATGHNLFVHEGLIFEGNYTSGLRIFDASDPLNVTEIAYFDTHPEIDTDGYDGLWAPYPYLPSGTILGNDRQRGLFIWQLPTATTTGDVDLDGDVDFTDLLIVLSAWGECAPKGECPADVDGDGTVGFTDLLLLLANWT
ncbi:MAG: choice-of-anchor B family protein, partial [Phycisphaerales bacterium]|nr:choice-of-anchor B family protein [Phycisphaerae bacterium]NNM26746.1 choice-of-anchor B family protein [Phycisphaerales bacterium]